MKINYSSIPEYLELDKKEVRKQLNKAHKERENYEHDLFFENGLTVVMELNYNSCKWDFKEYYIKGHKIAL